MSGKITQTWKPEIVSPSVWGFRIWGADVVTQQILGWEQKRRGLADHSQLLHTAGALSSRESPGKQFAKIKICQSQNQPSKDREWGVNSVQHLQCKLSADAPAWCSLRSKCGVNPSIFLLFLLFIPSMVGGCWCNSKLLQAYSALFWLFS